MKLTAREEKLIKTTFPDLTQTMEFLQRPVILTKAEGLYCWDRDSKR